MGRCSNERDASLACPSNGHTAQAKLMLDSAERIMYGAELMLDSAMELQWGAELMLCEAVNWLKGTVLMQGEWGRACSGYG